MSRFAVTNAEYRDFVAATDDPPPSHWPDGEMPEAIANHPVVNVSADDADRYCRWLGATMPGSVRLPSEAEWEYAARGREGRRYPWGDQEPTVELANYIEGPGATVPVDAHSAGCTPEGIYQLAGNVWEWCGDYLGDYEDLAEDSIDPVGATPDRALRGGAFSGSANALRASYRNRYRLRRRYVHIGFRVVWREDTETK